MSKNVRQKYPRAPAKASRRRVSDTSSSSFSLSDDEDGYSGVEEISESDEDDEDHVTVAEEAHIISRAVRKHSPEPSRPEQDVGEDADEEEDDEEDEEPNVLQKDDDEDEEEEEDEGEDDDDEAESASWDGILSEIDEATSDQVVDQYFEQEIIRQRHVRFAGVPDSDSDSTTSETSDNEDHGSLFPDIFVEQNSLDPSFRREIEYDDDSSNSGTFWDYHNPHVASADSDDETFTTAVETTPMATPMASQVASEVSTPTPDDEAQELDGYESEFGCPKDDTGNL